MKTPETITRMLTTFVEHGIMARVIIAKPMNFLTSLSIDPVLIIIDTQHRELSTHQLLAFLKFPKCEFLYCRLDQSVGYDGSLSVSIDFGIINR